MRQIDPSISVSGQIQPADVPALASAGFRMIVNNRPDGEQPGQPSASQIEVAARAAGLDYRHVPVAGGLTPQQIDAMAEALGAATGPVFAFCAAGTRSTYLWALAQAAAGEPMDELIAKAAAAGYDIGAIRAYLR